MKTTMRARVRAYLAQRRTLGFRLRSEGYLLLSFAHYADRYASHGRLRNKLAIAWASLPKDADRHRWAERLRRGQGQEHRAGSQHPRRVQPQDRP